MKNKTTLIVVGIVLSVLFVFIGLFASANNKMVYLEEQVNGAQANIEIVKIG